MKQTLVFTVLLCAVTAGAAAFRLPELDLRPMHADEAVQAARFRQMWLTGRYVYDPNEFHGPTLSCATLPAVWWSQAKSFADTSEATYRAPPALVGAGLVLLLWLLADAIGKPAALYAGVLTAISPAMVFYSRYYIHEMLLVFFTCGMTGSAWRAARSGRLVWHLAAGAFAGLMQSTKETSVLAFAAMAIALALTACWNRFAPVGPLAPLALALSPLRKTPGGEGTPPRSPSRETSTREASVGASPTRLSCLNSEPLNTEHSPPEPAGGERTPPRSPSRETSGLDAARAARPYERLWRPAAGAAAAVLVTIVLMSSFFTNLDGPLDAVLAYAPWLSRAGGRSPHAHPWWFYLHILTGWRKADGPFWSEALILALAAAGFFIALLPARRRLPPGANAAFVRWAGFYTLALTVAYSVIPYKTPWCLLSFLHGMIILAGVGAAALIRIAPGPPAKVVLGLGLLAAGGQLGWQSYRASYIRFADPRNPYAYAQTSPDIQRLSHDLEQLRQSSPAGSETVVKVIWSDAHYWPLPWRLRRFQHVGYWTEIPRDPAAPIVISSPQYDALLTARLDATHLMTGYYQVRPNVLAQLWVRVDLWEAHLRRLGRL